MSQIQLMLQMEVPSTADQKEEKPKGPSVEDQVREALECIDSGHDSHVEWNMIRRLYRQLHDMKKKSPRVENLMKMIEPVLQKYGYFGVV